MIKKLQPVKLSEESSKAISHQLGTQEVVRSAPKSLDPVNFPVFEIPVNQKVLIYVPNHVHVDDNGVEELMMDKPLIHSVRDGNRFLSYRCISGITDEAAGFDGSCPLCDGTAEPWDLARKQIEQQCKVQGLDPEDTDNTDVKSIRSKAFSDRVVKEATRYFTFPIVVIETVNNDGKTLAKDDKGQMVLKTMWYSISEQAYEDKWKKVFESLDDEPTHPGGHFFILNYCYTPKRGEPNKRDSARNMVVVGKTIKNSDNIKSKLDKMTEEWTPEKARETVVNNVLYSHDDLVYVTDSALENTRNMLAIYEGSAATAAIGAGNATGGFELGEAVKPELPNEAGASPVQMDETDDDIDDM